MATPAVAAPARLAQALELDRTGSVPRVRLHDPGAAVDLGGIAKGYAVDLAARVLRDRGIFHALVNAGGDLVALGTDGEGEPWTVGVRSPDGSGRVVEVLGVTDAAVATSGTYLQGAHLLDPRSAAPVRTSTRSLTVEAATCMDADAAATALFGAPAEERRRILHAAAPGARIAHTL
jgi:thiamine biosynthesis lipoprotein